MPFPSKGCKTCKTRRIKCDETQPVCKKCMKSHRVCEGMTAGEDYSMLHNENFYASGQKKRPRGPRASSIEQMSGSQDLVIQRPIVDLKTQATMYYLNYHMQQLNDSPSIFKSVSNDFLDIWQSGTESPILELALSSMSLAVFSRTHQHRPAAVEGTMRYQQLLRLTQGAIVCLSGENIDTCLLAIYFMSRYEQVFYRSGPLDSKVHLPADAQASWSHHDGALAILKIWKDQLSHKHPATDVIKHTRRAMYRSAILRNIGLPEWIQDGSVFGEHGLELAYDRLVIQIIDVRQRLFRLLEATLNQQCAMEDLDLLAEELNIESRDIDKELEDWAEHIPRIWRCQRHNLPEPHPWPMRDYYSPIVASYSNPAYAGIWNHYFSMRMLLNSTRLRVLKLTDSGMNGFIDEQRLECFTNIEHMADELASTVPYCLEKFRVIYNSDSSYQDDSNITIVLNAYEDVKPYMANLIAWPLSIASALVDLDAKHRSWFRSELVRLGRMLGDGVLESAESDAWLEI